MSIIISNYEISIWDDVLINGEFVEQKKLVIGSDKMLYQGKVFEPQFTKKANGEKKLTFKLYKQYEDIITGKKVDNLFYNELISERKVKLFYEDCWYDFVIKNIQENSSTKLCTYSLEDALVQELSKNGFETALDVELRNNLGTAQELATTALSTTDWQVESDRLTEYVEEGLVYLISKKPFEAYKIIEDEMGIVETQLATIPGNTEFLAFYSSCKNKPHRFQFIYLSPKEYGDYNKDKVAVDENRNIIIQNCQYYIDFSHPTDYIEKDGFFLPENFDVSHRLVEENENTYDTTISNWYRGKRFGFSQKTQYVPLLEKYCNIYEKDNGEQYYGYVTSTFVSPTLVQDFITNGEFKGVTGWTGTYSGESKNKKNVYAATVSSQYGRFVNFSFQTAEEALKSGDFDTNVFHAYLFLQFPKAGMESNNNEAFVINSGFHDNRAVIQNISPGDEWILDITAHKKDGSLYTPDELLSRMIIELREVEYDAESGGHSKGILWGRAKAVNGKIIIPLDNLVDVDISSKEFLQRQIKLLFTPIKNGGTSTFEFYIRKISLYKKIQNSQGEILSPSNQNIEGFTYNTYNFVKQDSFETALSKEELNTISLKEEDIDYNIYKPIYNNNAEKVRTITIKESNYFNILQSISETFESWLEILVERNDPDNPGRVTAKRVKFKKYLGSNNYAAFRYGVNLKDISRTYESKAITSKLIVKQNTNSLGKNGFCTIARAGSNPTGENNLYDFRYFFNMGMMNAEDYVAQLYYEKNPLTKVEQKGKDVNPTDTETNVQNFVNRIKKINNQIQHLGEQITGVSQELNKLESEKVVQEGLYETAAEALGTAREEFFAITGKYPNQLNTNPFSRVEWIKGEKTWGDLETLNPTWAGAQVSSGSDLVQLGPINSLDWSAEISLDMEGDNNYANSRTYYIEPKFRYYQDNAPSGDPIPRKIAVQIKPGTWHSFFTFSLSDIDTSGSTLQKLLTEYIEYSKQYKESKAKLENTGTQIGLIQQTEEKRKELERLNSELQLWKKMKNTLNQVFYSTYYRFIQEGTWIGEEYVDDDKYYNDAQSVLFNSCFPQVAYSINVVTLQSLPGYEYFNFGLGDKTYVEDPEFFGGEGRMEVVITEQTFNLDDCSKNTVKAQNFKDQFQDLFQKITATTQQAQYNNGSYEKAAALVEANDKIKGEFVGGALSGMSGEVSIAGQTTVVQDLNGITLTDKATKNQLRLIGGAIMMNTPDPITGERIWKNGLTANGLSASLITAGTINAGNIVIMNANEPTFKWDAFGISAFDIDWAASEDGTRANPNRFVRFDKYGLYGINPSTFVDSIIDGNTWKPTSQEEIDARATFALTWQGLKVTGEDNAIARLGKITEEGKIRLFQVKNKDGKETLSIDSDGNIIMDGKIDATTGKIGPFDIGEYRRVIGYDEDFQEIYESEGQSLIYNHPLYIDQEYSKDVTTVVVNKNGLTINNEMFGGEDYLPGIRFYGGIYNRSLLKPFIMIGESTDQSVGTTCSMKGEGLDVNVDNSFSVLSGGLYFDAFDFSLSVRNRNEDGELGDEYGFEINSRNLGDIIVKGSLIPEITNQEGRRLSNLGSEENPWDCVYCQNIKFYWGLGFKSLSSWYEEVNERLDNLETKN